jgi:hypothetical protein
MPEQEETLPEEIDAGNAMEEPEPTETEVLEEPVATVTEPEQFDWSQFTGADHLKGRSVQEVINYLNQRDQQYGKQTHELGELRSYRERLEALQRQATGQPAPVKKPTFTEGQKYEFARKFQDDPLGAVSEFTVPQLAEQLKPMLLEQVRQELGPTLQNQAQYVATQTEYASLVRNHPEIQTDQELRWTTMQIMGPEYLGENVPFEQAMFLAKLGKDEPSLFGNVCYLMKRGISFDEAKEYAQLKQNAPANAETKKQQLKEELTGLRGSAKTSTKKRGDSEPEIKTMDDAFDIAD